MTQPDSDYDRLIGPIEERMIRTVWRVLRDPMEAEEAFQEALARIWEGRETIRRHPNPPALILRICLNAAYDSLRQRKRRLRQEGIKNHEDRLTSATVSPPEMLARQEQQEQILHAISQLSRNQAIAVLMRHVQQLPYDEIAQALGCSEATVRTHVTRGRRRLSAHLDHLSQIQ